MIALAPRKRVIKRVELSGIRSYCPDCKLVDAELLVPTKEEFAVDGLMVIVCQKCNATIGELHLVLEIENESD